MPDVGAVSDSDIISFMATSLGNNTSGNFELYFDGSYVESSEGSEGIVAPVPAFLLGQK